MNIKEHITKYTDLNANDSLSGFKNHLSQQSHNVYQVFYDFLKEIRPKQILEIGTALGGFTSFLKIICEELNLDTTILSYDIYARDWYSDMIAKGIDVRVENVFSLDYKEVKQEVIDFIQKDGTTLVLCDGGNKIEEFKILSKHIKNGDFILAHDYSIDKETYSQHIFNKIWNWCEITESDIKDSCIENNLEFYKQDIFFDCVWVCKQKIK